jgi:poly(A) polymerase
MIKKPTSDHYRSAERIVRRLQDAGHEALLAGGCVRDLLLGAEPKDYDVATSADAAQVEALFPQTKPVGAEFGVVLVILNGRSFEVTSFRTEQGYTDGRHPDAVASAGVLDDAHRRDFTINGMYWDPVSGKLLDVVGGQLDLQARILRAIGDPEQRFREDHLRIVRAVRFAARLGLSIEPETRRALKALADLVQLITPERLQQELRIILTDRDPALALRMMDELGMLTRIFPELGDAKGCEQPKNYHPEGDVFVHTILTVEKLGPHPDFVLAMAALLHDVGKPEASRLTMPEHFPEHERIGCDMALNICRRLRMPRDETERICWLVSRHMYFRDAHKMKDSTMKRLFAERDFDLCAELHRADALASWGNLEAYDYVLERKRSMPPETIDPRPLINGRDLIAMGYEPGPAFRRILDAVREMQLQGELTGRDEALAAARRLADEGQ